MPRRGRLEITGASGPIENTFLRQDGSRLAVVLPGRRGGWLAAAIYYPVIAMLDEGFDALCLESIYIDAPSPATLRDDANAVVRAGRAAGEYRQVALVGKSLGTLAMAELIASDAAFAYAPSIWLTPLLRNDRVAAALERLGAPGLIVVGTQDPLHDVDVLSGLEAQGHRVLVLAGAHHGLAIDGDAPASAEIPRELVRAVLDYLRDPTVREA
jgi:pimeloyl-ACP methyl ester carboxylesterase